MSKAIAGPWTQNFDEQRYMNDAEITIGNVDEGRFMEICVVTDWNYNREQAKANARLIAAAPMMLEALKAMVITHGGLGSSPAIRSARAAILAATGEDGTTPAPESREASSVNGGK